MHEQYRLTWLEEAKSPANNGRTAEDANHSENNSTAKDRQMPHGIYSSSVITISNACQRRRKTTCYGETTLFV